MTRERDRATHSKTTSEKDVAANTSSSSASSSSSSSRSKRQQQHHSKPDREPRARHHGTSQGTRSSSSSSQRQDQARGRGEGGDKGFGHAHHLRFAREQQPNWGNSTTDKKLSPSDKLTSPNRFERLSLSEDTPTTTTSNRFDVLDPENEDFSPEGIVEKAARGRLSKRSRSPSKKASVKDDGEDNIKDLDDFDDGVMTDDMESESPVAIDNTTLTTEGETMESCASEEKVTESSRETANSEEGEKEEESPGKSSTSRIRYSRDELLHLKKAPLSVQKPTGLGSEILKYAA